MGSVCSKGIGFVFRVMNVLELDSGGSCKYTKTHQTVHIKNGEYYRRELYFSDK